MGQLSSGSPAPLVLLGRLELRSHKITCVEVFSTGSACSRGSENVPLAPPFFLRRQITGGYQQLSLYSWDQSFNLPLLDTPL